MPSYEKKSTGKSTKGNNEVEPPRTADERVEEPIRADHPAEDKKKLPVAKEETSPAPEVRRDGEVEPA